MSEQGRYVRCGHCGGRVHFKPGQLWECRIPTTGERAQLRIVHCDRDGAIVEQVGREGIEPRWGLSYAEILLRFDRASSAAQHGSGK